MFGRWGCKAKPTVFHRKNMTVLMHLPAEREKHAPGESREGGKVTFEARSTFQCMSCNVVLDACSFFNECVLLSLRSQKKLANSSPVLAKVPGYGLQVRIRASRKDWSVPTWQPFLDIEHF